MSLSILGHNLSPVVCQCTSSTFFTGSLASLSPTLSCVLPLLLLYLHAPLEALQTSARRPNSNALTLTLPGHRSSP